MRNREGSAMAIQCISCNKKNIQEVVKENHLYFFCSDCNELYERAVDNQFGKDVIVNGDEGVYHVTAGAALKQGNCYLLLKRRTYPFGYDFPGGHVEYGEDPFDTLNREVMEETGLQLRSCKLIFSEKIHGSKCRYGVDCHLQNFYLCEPEEGIPLFNPESEGIGWYTAEEMQELPLTPGSRYLLEHALHL